MKKKILAATFLISWSAFASAHGQDIFVPVYIQLLAVFATVCVLLLAPRLKNYRIGGIASCFIGAMSSWPLTTRLAFADNQNLISIIDGVLPFAFAAVFVFWRHRQTRR